MNCRIPSHLEFLPSLDVLSKISGVPYLDNSDIENNLPNPINSKYYYFHDFEKMTLSSNKSVIFLLSLHALLDDLHATLYLLGFRFQVISVSETRENVLRGFKMNNALQGCNLHSQPSRSAAGGFALYTSKSLNAVKRTDLRNLKLFGLRLRILNQKVFCGVVSIGTLRPLLKDSLSILRPYCIT